MANCSPKEFQEYAAAQLDSFWPTPNAKAVYEMFARGDVLSLETIKRNAWHAPSRDVENVWVEAGVKLYGKNVNFDPV